MDQANTELTPAVAGKPVYRRDFRKKDGRALFLYGFTPHVEPPLGEQAGDIAKGGELRWHPLRREWNIYAAHRQNRTFKPSAAENPLAPSQPKAAPTEIPFTAFEVAVFENKFTSLHADAPAPAADHDVKRRSAKGQCEVVVYSSDAEGSLASLSQDKRRLLLAAWIDRYEALFDKGCKFILPFENRGEEVGVTLHHPHGQIYGFPFIPVVQANAAAAFSEGYNLSDDIASFRQHNLLIAEAGAVSMFSPPFSRFPFETWIAPNRKAPGPWALSEEELDGFAFLLGDITRRYDEYFQRSTPYMLGLHAAPAETFDHYHFTAQIYPLLRAPDRVKFLASVEQHTGVFTVDVMPEHAAEILRAL
ncbi:MAG: galactose-1-phosphate uridylyltransferase [Pseudomonadota bacterium]